MDITSICLVLLGIICLAQAQFPMAYINKMGECIPIDDDSSDDDPDSRLIGPLGRLRVPGPALPPGFAGPAGPAGPLGSPASTTQVCIDTRYFTMMSPELEEQVVNLYNHPMPGVPPITFRDESDGGIDDWLQHESGMSSSEELPKRMSISRTETHVSPGKRRQEKLQTLRAHRRANRNWDSDYEQ